MSTNKSFSYGFYSSAADKPTILAGSGPFSSIQAAISGIIEEYNDINGGNPPLGLEFGVKQNGVFTKYLYKSGEFSESNIGIGIVPSGSSSINISSEIPTGVEGDTGDANTALSTAGAYALAQTIASSNSGVTDVKVGTTSVVNTGVATIPVASSNALGTIKIGYSTSGKNYAVQLSNDKAYVNVPWTNTTYSAATSSAEGLMSAADKTKLDGIASGAAVNQNAFSKISVNNTLMTANAVSDTFTLAAGTNISLSMQDKTITINSTGGGSGIPVDFIEVVEPGIYNIDENFEVEPVAVASSVVSGGSSGDIEEKVNRIIAILGHLYDSSSGDGTFVISQV